MAPPQADSVVALSFSMLSCLQQEAFIERLALAAADLAQEVFLEPDFCQMHPGAFRRPVHVARRDLRLGDEGDAAVTEIGEADGVPGRLRARFLPAQQCADIVGRRRHHALDHEAGLRHADRHRRRPGRRDRDAHADAEHVAPGRVALVLVHQHEAARVDELLDPAHRRHAAERRQHHGERERQVVRGAQRAVLGDLLHRHRGGLGALQPRVGDPLDVAAAELALHAAPWCRRRHRARDGRYRAPT